MSTAPAKEKPPLLRLPRELHDEIFSYIIAPGYAAIDEGRDEWKSTYFRDRRGSSQGTRTRLALLLICRELYPSALETLYHATAFRMDVTDSRAQEPIIVPPVTGMMKRVAVRVCNYHDYHGASGQGIAADAQAVVACLNAEFHGAHIHVAFRCLLCSGSRYSNDLIPPFERLNCGGLLTMSWKNGPDIDSTRNLLYDSYMKLREELHADEILPDWAQHALNDY